MKANTLALALGGLIRFPLAILADGKVFPGIRVDPVVLIPDQGALIRFENGVERLVIETSCIGSGTNFAWVIPLPGVPKIEPASPAMFDILASAFQPRLVHNVRPYWLAFLVTGIWVYLVSRSVRGEVAWINDLPACVIVSCIAGWTLRYVREGWVFVAAKVRRDTPQAAPTTPHPLGFTFPTKKAVYPLRLTGAGNPTCRIDLYVFGNERTGAPHFTVASCRLTEHNSSFIHAKRPPQPLALDGLCYRWIGRAAVGTRLLGELSTADMKTDAYLQWDWDKNTLHLQHEIVHTPATVHGKLPFRQKRNALCP